LNDSRLTDTRRCGIAWLETLLALSILSLVLQLAWPSLESWRNRPRAGRQVPARFDGEAGSLGYLIYLPDDYGKSEQAWPLLLFLHGSGSRGRDLEKVRRGGPAAMIDSGRPFPMIVVTPQCPENSGWQPEMLLELLDELGKEFFVNPDHVFVTGYSMGGYGTWALAVADPDRFAAAAPLCGGGDTSRADCLAKLPIWAFHGEQDEAIPLKESQQMVEAIQEAGGDAKLTIFPDTGHGISHLVYNDDKFYEWLIAQKRLIRDSSENSLSDADAPSHQ